MDSIIKLGLVGAGMWAVHRALKAKDLGIPWEHALANPFVDLEALRAQAAAATGPKFFPIQASFPLPGGGGGSVKFAPSSGFDLSMFQRRI